MLGKGERAQSDWGRRVALVLQRAHTQKKLLESACIFHDSSKKKTTKIKKPEVAKAAKTGSPACEEGLRTCEWS